MKCYFQDCRIEFEFTVSDNHVSVWKSDQITLMYDREAGTLTVEYTEAEPKPGVSITKIGSAGRLRLSDLARIVTALAE
jgi:hypothetical protein